MDSLPVTAEMIERKFAEQGFAGRAADANPAVLAALRAAVRAESNPNPRVVAARVTQTGRKPARLSLVPRVDAKRLAANDLDED